MFSCPSSEKSFAAIIAAILLLAVNKVVILFVVIVLFCRNKLNAKGELNSQYKRNYGRMNE